MAWTAPRTYTAGEIITASILNSAVRDNLRYIKGLDGVPTIESGLTIDNTGGDERLLLPLLSTAECTTVLNAEGEVAFDEQTHQMKAYDGTAVRAMISEADVDDTPVDSATTVPVSSNWAYDHVAAADPHVGYVLESLADVAGDIFYASADNTWTRLGIGTALQVLQTNAGATAPQWGGTVTQIAASSYTGNGGNDRQITVGFACKLVIVSSVNYGLFVTLTDSYDIQILLNDTTGTSTDLLLHATDGFVVDAATCNVNTIVYYYVALG